MMKEREDATEQPFDAIIIGSGIGGLAFASLMAQVAKKRVLVLERHFKLGGFTHSFSRNGYTWDVGLHYVGHLAQGTLLRRLFDFITRSQVAWNKMPHRFEVFSYPQFSFQVPVDRNQYIQDLIREFPDEETGIRKYFDDLRRVAGWFGRETWSWSAPGWLAWPVRIINRRLRERALQTTREYLDHTVADERLKALLVSQWGDYGLPPSRSAFAMHAAVADSYLQGGWYPEGGSAAIAKSICRTIEEAGGVCLVNHEVTDIIVEEGKAVGVNVRIKRGGKTAQISFRSPLVVSDAGARQTFAKLLPEHVCVPFKAELEQMAAGTTTVATLYLGLNEDPRRLGFQGENHWIFSSCSHENAGDLVQDQITMAFLSFPSMKDPQAKRHTAEVILSVPYQSFQDWQGSAWMKRDESYRELKERMTETVLAYVEQRYPGFRDLVAYKELSTPLTVESFTGHHRGAIYGLPATPERIRRRWFGARTSIKGLLLTGADVCSLGIEGALMGGVFAAGAALGPLGFFRVMAAAHRHAAANNRRRENP
ncbi:MAG: phytoene desaturase family protein [Bacilli bacterium]